jgi:DinB superfamily
MAESQALGILEQTPGTLRTLLAGATREQLDWQPAAGRWSISMVLAHLAHAEVHGFRSRLEAMLAHDRPRLPSYDQLALFRDGARFDPYAEMARFQEERSRTLPQLRALPPGAAARCGEHAELGEITVEQLVQEFAFHDLGHIRQILELYRSHVFYPHMGAFQTCYHINP